MKLGLPLIVALVGCGHAAPLGRGKLDNVGSKASNSDVAAAAATGEFFNPWKTGQGQGQGLPGGLLHPDRWAKPSTHHKDEVIDTVLDLDDSDCNDQSNGLLGGPDFTDSFDRTRIYFNGKCRGHAWFKTHLVADGFKFVRAEGSAKMEEGPVVVTEKNGRGVVRRRTYRVANPLVPGGFNFVRSTKVAEGHVIVTHVGTEQNDRGVMRYTYEVNGFALLEEKVYEAGLTSDGLGSFVMTHMAQTYSGWELMDWRDITFVTPTAYEMCDRENPVNCLAAWANAETTEDSPCKNAVETAMGIAHTYCNVVTAQWAFEATKFVGGVTFIVEQDVSAVFEDMKKAWRNLRSTSSQFCKWLRDDWIAGLKDTCEDKEDWHREGGPDSNPEAESGEGNNGGGGGGGAGGDDPDEDPEPDEDDYDPEDEDPELDDCNDEDEDPNNDCDDYDDNQEGTDPDIDGDADTPVSAQP